MKTTLNYNCHRPDQASQLIFYVSGWRVRQYPLTYTVDECIEAWCDEVGWNLVSIRACSNIDLGLFYVELPELEDPMDTVRRISRLFNLGCL